MKQSFIKYLAEFTGAQTSTQTTIATATGIGGSFLSYLFGGWDVLIIALVVIVSADYITGLMAGAVEGKLSSKVGMVGIAKKVFIFIIVSMAHVVDMVLNNGSTLIRDGVIFFYLANELLSILENGGRIGVPIPPVIQRAVEALKGKGGIEDGKQP